MIYLDTSALVKLVVVEAESAALAGFLERYPADLFASVLGATELARALHARGFATHAARIAHPNAHVLRFPAHVVRLAPLTPAIALHAGSLAPGGQWRSLDALHIATARAAGAALEALVTYDPRISEAARAEGLPVTVPRAQPAPPDSL